ncbi:Serine/threonine-protein phosphatase PP1 [Trichinella pseudospiralis]|uniref:Serine/threonine-protein phosphatase n=1 Tax=Trichinella pseudospiralis TaxID=6337 RepID=A0A0V1IW22_TRIPS|nr:Serine/threonine-protein phosphatase PP1 [Trichinella pseudospiralis]KRZ26856.1 Serine/threonine-protein phosphatase PP1 [Trichinella pseudospiralis]KRZ40338.1 Serine/threonine-protein phosphatase PP1 [Trichinella pseudospiralis]
MDSERSGINSERSSIDNEAASSRQLLPDNQFFECMIQELLQNKPILAPDVERILRNALEVFKSESSLIEVQPPLIICGDIHGQFQDLVRLFNHGGWVPASRYLFLGDYVDRGPNSVETICMMLLLKIRHPKDLYLLRGNHETARINRTYGFYDDCVAMYSTDMWHLFQPPFSPNFSVFDYMPVAALVNNKIFCMHGGISPELESFDQIREIERPLQIPDDGLLCDLLWADPDVNAVGWMRSNRGVSYKFGPDVVEEFCQRMEVDLIARAHQVVENGWEFFADTKLVTIFSAPNYCNQFDNSAGLMFVGQNMSCTLKQLKPRKKKVAEE